MTDSLLELALSNAFAAAILALVALAAQRFARQPVLTHALWLLVLLRLVSPPVFTSPWAPLPALTTAVPAAAQAPAPSAAPAIDVAPVVAVTPTLSAGDWLLGAWLAGCVLLAGVSLHRLLRFRRSLARTKSPAPESVQALAREIATSLGLSHSPEILTTPARVTPFVFWCGGRPAVVLPDGLLAPERQRDLRMVLAHELAHVRRGDHFVRWIEWATCTLFWWNPLAWWARQNLRDQEELSCDLLVLDRLGIEPRGYARSLLDVAETLCSAGPRPPAFVSAMDSGGQLENRFKMILSNRLPRTPRWALSTAFLLGAALMPLSFVNAQDMDAIHKRLRAAVQAGEISAEQAKSMLDAIRKDQKPTPAPKQQGRDARPDAERMKARLAEFERKLVEQAKAGEITREQMRQKLAEARAKMEEAMGAKTDRAPQAKPQTDADPRRARLEALRRKLGESVRAGEMTRDEAMKRFEEVRSKMEAAAEPAPQTKLDADALKARYAEYERRLTEQVKAGEITRDEFRQKLEAARARISAATGAKTDVAPDNARLQQIQTRLRAAVERGDMTPEEARKKLAELRAQMSGNREGGREAPQQRRR
jgi:beta-lactamase regulating signal transducer with metallopeptidase domain/polyhydroxyalkanoate synthesis regulator phasin